VRWRAPGLTAAEHAMLDRIDGLSWPAPENIHIPPAGRD
jgi:hypothetical protein